MDAGEGEGEREGGAFLLPKTAGKESNRPMSFWHAAREVLLKLERAISNSLERNRHSW